LPIYLTPPEVFAYTEFRTARRIDYEEVNKAGRWWAL
jgi:hypothetical protein